MKKRIMFLLMINSFAIFSKEELFTYDNAWYVVYTSDSEDNVSWPLVAGGTTEKIPKTDCIVGSIKHKYVAPDDDNFSREVVCFEGKKEIAQEIFQCRFDTKYKNEDGEIDDTRTVCSKQYKGFRLVHEINRYPRDKYWQMKQKAKSQNDTRLN